MGIETALLVGSLAATVGSTALGAAGQAKQYGAAADEANYRAQVAANNQTIAQQNARYAAQAGQVNAQNQDFRTAATLGQARAAYGAAGVDPTTGSPSDVQSSISQLGRLGSLDAIQKAALQSYGYQTEATSYGAESGLQKYKAGAAQAAAPLAIGGTILGGVSSLSDKWLRYKNVGLTPFSGSSSSSYTGGGDFPGG